MRRVLVVLALFASCRRTIAPSERSVVIVTLDTTRADRIGALGGTEVPTPNLDRLAGQGTVASEAISQVPLTLPSHASIFTGRYPASHGVRHNGIYRLRPEEETLAEHLAALGFRTAAFVGAYVLNKGFGLEQGFETYDDVDVDRYAGGRDQTFEAQRTADDVNARVFPWLAAHRGERIFLWVHYYDPHEPYSPPEKAGRTLAGTGYDREISYVDACFGELIGQLRATGFLDRSLVIVMGDHGESLGEHGERAHGLFLYEGALHVPLFFRAPGLVPAGKTIRGPVELIDVAPTVLDYLGLPPLARAQGRALRGRIDGKDDGRAAVAHAETMMPRLEFGWADLRMVRDGRFKYIAAPRPELYDLKTDRTEDHDLAKDDGSRAAEMASALDEWSAATSDAAAAAASERTLTAEEAARLRSLGYLGTQASPAAAGAIDPKDGIGEIRAIDLARDKLAAGDAGGALAGIAPVLAADPANPQARLTRILALIQLPDLRAAEDEAKRALEISGGSDRARGILASVLRLEGKDREAEAEYRRLLASDPRNDPAAVDLARLLIATGRLDEAEHLLVGVTGHDARNGMALAARFELEVKRGDPAARLAAAKALVQSGAGDRATRKRAVKLLAEAGSHP